MKGGTYYLRNLINFWDSFRGDLNKAEEEIERLKTENLRLSEYLKQTGSVMLLNAQPLWRELDEAKAEVSRLKAENQKLTSDFALATANCKRAYWAAGKFRSPRDANYAAKLREVNKRLKAENARLELANELAMEAANKAGDEIVRLRKALEEIRTFCAAYEVRGYCASEAIRDIAGSCDDALGLSLADLHKLEDESR